MRKLILSILMLAVADVALAAEKVVYKQGEKNWVDTAHYFTYEFNQRPKIGYDIVIVKMFDKDGARVTDYAIVAVSGMPSMPSMGSTPETPFKLNKKGDYLFPVDAVMLGAWQVSMKIVKDKKIVSSGVILFDVK